MTFHLAVALKGTGWHPASPSGDVYGAEHWVGQIQEAERGLATLVTLEDGFASRSLDSVLIALRAGPVTSNIGLVPTVVTTHTEPFHVSTQIATLDWVTKGRAGERLKVSADEAEAALFGRRDTTKESGESLFDEAADHVEVQRRLWDSWEDDAEIRDAATNRFVDRDKLHYIDFVGPYFAVRGPSITPRPPQGQPIVTALAHVQRAYRLGARSADVVFTTPDGQGREGPTGDAGTTLRAVRAAEAEIGRGAATGESLSPAKVVGDLLVFLDDDATTAQTRWSRLDAEKTMRTDAAVLAGTVADVADRLEAWAADGLDGARLRPAVAEHDLPRITRELAPELARRGLTRTAYEADTLRGLLGLEKAPNRYTPDRHAGAVR